MDVCFALVFPYLIYCVTVWGTISKSKLSNINVAHQRIICAMCDSDWLAHSQPLFTDLNLMNFQQIVTYMCGLYVFKALDNNLCTNFTYRDNPSNTRSSTRSVLGTPPVSNNHSRQGIKYIGAVEYNEIPLSIRSSPSYDNCKIKFERFIMQ